MIYPHADALDTALATLTVPHREAIAAAQARQDRLTKPRGSLGRLEEIAVFMAGWQGREVPRLDRAACIVFAGNHGVVAQGVSAFPAEVTAQMVANFETGGAAINALAGAAGMELAIVPIALENPTQDFTQGPAMSAIECLQALSIGAAAVDPGLDLLLVGEMGIGNTTAAAALCALALGGSGSGWVGAGTGLDEHGVRRKARVVDQALQLHHDAPRKPLETLRRVGGREIAAMAGAILRARELRIPVMLDGFIATSALAPLVATAPGLAAHCLAGHTSREPGHARLLARL
ncbi:nicotinate-nucleotide--dimethylbenzimidazole phosphoribosyltransferase, partial [Novosphingobium sp. 1949]